MKLAFTILGEMVSMKNSREIVRFGTKLALIKSKKARDYERRALRQIPESAKQMLTCRVRGTARLFYASERPDADAELLWDILAAKYKRSKGELIKLRVGEYGYGQGERKLVREGVYVNDRQVREKHCYHAIDKANPRAEIEIETMDPQQPDLLVELDDEDEAETTPF